VKDTFKRQIFTLSRLHYYVFTNRSLNSS